MCGRARLSSDVSEIKLVFSIPPERPTPNIPANWNAAPTEDLPVVRYDAKAGQRSLDVMRWGLVPFWAKDIKVGFANINAKAEGIDTKPAFREAFARRRCLVPFDCFYEWKKLGKDREPYAVGLADRRLMALAGLWETWRSPAGERVRSFAIVTTAAECPARLGARPHAGHSRPGKLAGMARREPADPERLKSLLVPYPAEDMVIWPVDKRVGNVKNKDPSLIEPRGGGLMDASERRRGRTAFPLPLDLPPMEARLVDDLPEEPGWQFEPKWDGFRCLAFRAGDEVELRAKSGKPLGALLPGDGSGVAASWSRAAFVLDGELAIPVGETFSFDALQMRLHPAESRIRKLAAETPAVLILFDLLATPERRKPAANAAARSAVRLSKAFFIRSDSEGAVRISPFTRDIAEARRWLEASGGALDGVIAKRLDGVYEPGERAMLKVKKRRTADCVVGGFPLRAELAPGRVSAARPLQQ